MPASRTPDGFEHRCPICGRSPSVTPSAPLSDAPCSYCGALLWPIPTHDEPQWRPDMMPEGVRARLLSRLDLYSRSRDSLDYVELVMEVEETIGDARLLSAVQLLESPDKFCKWLSAQLV